MKMKYTFGAMIFAATVAAGTTATPAEAHSKRYNHYHSYNDDRGYDYRDRRDRRRYDRRRNYRKCDRGRGGTVIGAVVGGLLGNEIAGRGSRTEGAIIGAAVGALGGRAIDKADDPCRRKYRYRR